MAFYNVYADESRQRGHRFMLFGALFVPRGDVENDFLADVTAFREQRQLAWEIKWHKVSPAATSAYVEFAELFFVHPLVEFRCLAVDTHQIDYQRFHDNDREKCFYNFYFTFLSRNLNPTHRYLIRTDDRSNREKHRLTELKRQLNDYGREKGATRDVVANVEPGDSKDHQPLQMTDLLLGAVGYAIEEYKTSEAKRELVTLLETRLGTGSLREHRGRDTRFNIWVFDFSRAAKEPKK